MEQLQHERPWYCESHPLEAFLASASTQYRRSSPQQTECTPTTPTLSHPPPPYPGLQEQSAGEAEQELFEQDVQDMSSELLRLQGPSHTQTTHGTHNARGKTAAAQAPLSSNSQSEYDETEDADMELYTVLLDAQTRNMVKDLHHSSKEDKPTTDDRNERRDNNAHRRPVGLDAAVTAELDESHPTKKADAAVAHRRHYTNRPLPSPPPESQAHRHHNHNSHCYQHDMRRASMPANMQGHKAGSSGGSPSRGCGARTRSLALVTSTSSDKGGSRTSTSNNAAQHRMHQGHQHGSREYRKQGGVDSSSSSSTKDTHRNSTNSNDHGAGARVCQPPQPPSPPPRVRALARRREARGKGSEPSSSFTSLTSSSSCTWSPASSPHRNSSTPLRDCMWPPHNGASNDRHHNPPQTTETEHIYAEPDEVLYGETDQKQQQQQQQQGSAAAAAAVTTTTGTSTNAGNGSRAASSARVQVLPPTQATLMWHQRQFGDPLPNAVQRLTSATRGQHHCVVMGRHNERREMPFATQHPHSHSSSSAHMSANRSARCVSPQHHHYHHLQRRQPQHQQPRGAGMVAFDRVSGEQVRFAEKHTRIVHPRTAALSSSAAVAAPCLPTQASSPESFLVLLMPTPATTAAGLAGTFFAEFQRERLVLLTPNSHRLVWQVGYGAVKRFAVDRSVRAVSVEIGSPHGARCGVFCFKTSEHDAFFRSLQCRVHNQ